MVTGYSVRKVKKLNPEDRTITENIHELDIPSLIKKTMKKKGIQICHKISVPLPTEAYD